MLTKAVVPMFTSSYFRSLNQKLNHFDDQKNDGPETCLDIFRYKYFSVNIVSISISMISMVCIYRKLPVKIFKHVCRILLLYLYSSVNSNMKTVFEHEKNVCNKNIFIILNILCLCIYII